MSKKNNSINISQVKALFQRFKSILLAIRNSKRNLKTKKNK